MGPAAARGSSVVTLCIIRDADVGINLDGMHCLNDPSFFDVWKLNLPSETYCFSLGSVSSEDEKLMTDPTAGCKQL